MIGKSIIGRLRCGAGRFLCVIIASSIASTAAADLNVAITASPDPPRAGELLDVKVTVTNDGQFAESNVTATVTFPAGLAAMSNSYFDGTCPGSACESGETATFNIGTLAAGRGVTYHMPAQVAFGTADGTDLLFEAAALADGKSADTDSDTITVDSTRELNLALVEHRNPVSPGDMVTYTLSYGVAQTSPGVSNAVLRLPIPSGATFVNASDGAPFAGNVVEWSLGNLNPGRNGKRTVTVEYDAASALGSIHIAEAEFSDASDNVVAYRSAVSIQSDSPIEIAVVADPDPARQGETLNVLLTVSNTGLFDRTGVVLQLSIPTHFSALSNTHFDGTCPGSTCDARELAIFNIGTLPSGKSLTFSAPLRVSPGTETGLTLAFHAALSDGTGDQRRSASAIATDATRELELALTTDRDPATPGGVMTYTMDWGVIQTSAGVVGSALALTLPADATFVDAVGDPTVTGDVVEWSLGNLGPGRTGQARVTVQFDSDLDPGALRKAVAVFSTASDHLVRSETATRLADPMPLDLRVTAGPNPAQTSETLGLELTVTNTGLFDRNDVVLRFETPDHVAGLSNTYYDGACPGSACETPERAVINIGTLKPGRGATYYLPIRIAAGTNAGIVTTFAADLSDNTGDLARAAASVAVDTQRSVDLAFRDSDDPKLPGDEVTYTLTWGARQTGPAAPDATLHFTAPPGAQVTWASNDGVIDSNATSDVVEWSIGGLNPGHGGRRIVTVQTDSTAAAGSLLTASAMFDDGAANPRRVRFEQVTRLEGTRPLELELVAWPPGVAPGNSLNNLLSVTNTTAFDRTGVTLRWEIGDGLNALSNTTFGGACPGSACEAQERAVFSVGTLGPGETVTFPISPTVANSTPQGAIIRFNADAFDDEGVSARDGASIMAGTNFDFVTIGDLTGDGVVGGADLGTLLSAWGACDDCDLCLPDLNADCVVGGADLGTLLSNWSN